MKARVFVIWAACAAVAAYYAPAREIEVILLLCCGLNLGVALQKFADHDPEE